MKRSSTGIGHGTAANAQCSSGELSPTQRAILASIRNDGPGTEAEIYSALSSQKKPDSMAAMRDDLAELESRMLVKCTTQPNGRRIWGKA